MVVVVIPVIFKDNGNDVNWIRMNRKFDPSKTLNIYTT